MNKEIKRSKIELDATDVPVGRLATKIATTLRGKDKASFVRHIDAGDYVTVINCSKVKFTGRKMVQKDYRHHSMYPGGLKVTSAKRIFENDPTKIVEHAVYGMLPKNRQRDEIMKRLTLKK